MTQAQRLHPASIAAAKQRAERTIRQSHERIYGCSTWELYEATREGQRQRGYGCQRHGIHFDVEVIERETRGRRADGDCDHGILSDCPHFS